MNVITSADTTALTNATEFGTLLVMGICLKMMSSTGNAHTTNTTANAVASAFRNGGDVTMATKDEVFHVAAFWATTGAGWLWATGRVCH